MAVSATCEAGGALLDAQGSSKKTPATTAYVDGGGEGEGGGGCMRLHLPRFRAEVCCPGVEGEILG